MITRLLRRTWPGITAAVAASALAAAYVWLFGEMFGVWGYADLAMGLLGLEVAVCVALGAVRGPQNPYTRVAPGGPLGPFGSGPAGPGLDPQTSYFGTAGPIEERAHATGDNRWFWWAVSPGIALIVLIAQRLI